MLGKLLDLGPDIVMGVLGSMLGWNACTIVANDNMENEVTIDDLILM